MRVTGGTVTACPSPHAGQVCASAGHQGDTAGRDEVRGPPTHPRSPFGRGRWPSTWWEGRLLQNVGRTEGPPHGPGAASPHAQPHLVCHSAPSLARSLRAALCFSSSRSFSWLARSRAGAELGKGPGRTARPLVPLCWGPRGGAATGKPSPARGPVRSGPQRASPAGAVPPAKLATPPRPAGSPRRPAVAPRGCRCPDPGRCVREAGCPPRAALPPRPPHSTCGCGS